MFLRLEQPAPPGAPAEGDGYETIGQFYAAIEQGLRHLCDRLGEQAVFCGDPARQVNAGHFRHTAGRLIAVDGLDSALAALEEIVEQGEGTARGEVWDGDQDIFHPERDEVAHYYRFQELKVGRRYRRGDTPQSGPTGETITVDLAAVRRCGTTRGWPTTLRAARSAPPRRSSTTPTAPSCICSSRRSTAARSCSRSPPAPCTRSRPRPRP